MAVKKFTAMIAVMALVVMGSAITGEAISVCAKDCMPSCLGVAGSTIPNCEKTCEAYCKTQGQQLLSIPYTVSSLFQNLNKFCMNSEFLPYVLKLCLPLWNLSLGNIQNSL
ncbi:hypothetical protein ACSBR1_027194 [Camellia fascicularis]